MPLNSSLTLFNKGYEAVRLQICCSQATCQAIQCHLYTEDHCPGLKGKLARVKSHFCRPRQLSEC